jgi:hypothetical protein
MTAALPPLTAAVTATVTVTLKCARLTTDTLSPVRVLSFLTLALALDLFLFGYPTPICSDGHLNGRGSLLLCVYAYIACQRSRTSCTP